MKENIGKKGKIIQDTTSHNYKIGEIVEIIGISYTEKAYECVNNGICFRIIYPKDLEIIDDSKPNLKNKSETIAWLRKEYPIGTIVKSALSEDKFKIDSVEFTYESENECYVKGIKLSTNYPEPFYVIYKNKFAEIVSEESKKIPKHNWKINPHGLNALEKIRLKKVFESIDSNSNYDFVSNCPYSIDDENKAMSSGNFRWQGNYDGLKPDITLIGLEKLYGISQSTEKSDFIPNMWRKTGDTTIPYAKLKTITNNGLYNSQHITEYIENGEWIIKNSVWYSDDFQKEMLKGIIDEQEVIDYIKNYSGKSSENWYLQLNIVELDILKEYVKLLPYKTYGLKFNSYNSHYFIENGEWICDSGRTKDKERITLSDFEKKYNLTRPKSESKSTTDTNYKYKKGDYIILKKTSIWNSKGEMDHYIGKCVQITSINDVSLKFDGQDRWEFDINSIERLATTHEIMYNLLDTKYYFKYNKCISEIDFPKDFSYRIIKDPIQPKNPIEIPMISVKKVKTFDR